MSERAEKPRVLACDVSCLTEPDADTVDALARLHVAAKRAGSRLELYGAPTRLMDLLELVGLAEVLPCRSDLGVEMDR